MEDTLRRVEAKTGSSVCCVSRWFISSRWRLRRKGFRSWKMKGFDFNRKEVGIHPK